MIGNYGKDFHAPRVDIHKFSMVPRANIPRSTFRMESQHKTTIQASDLIPVYLQEVLPGDSFNVSMTAFVRMSTPLVPIMDNLDLESWFFFVPCRILWTHWVNMMGEQPQSPSDSISYTLPTTQSPTGGAATYSLQDYFGIPGTGQVGGGNQLTINALPFRAYNMIWNQWFRDQNLDTAQGYGATFTVYDLGDGPDPWTNYQTLQVRKRHDYFTSCLPWAQKGLQGAITVPMAGSATVKTSSTALVTGAQTSGMALRDTSTGNAVGAFQLGTDSSGFANVNATAFTPSPAHPLYPSNLYADLTTAAGATINALRLAFQTQRLLERDARGGTRYQELLMSHFGVRPLDSRVQRPEYLGGGKTPVNITPVPQTSATGLTGGTTPTGNLAAVGTAVAHAHGYRGSFTEHGYILGLVAIRADCTYQQGLRRLWTRSTRYDFYWPVFAMLGEQAVRNDEIYAVGTPAQDTATFGFNERWSEYRYHPSVISGAFRSTATTPLDLWHVAQKFTALPALNASFMAEPTSAVLARNLAAGASAAHQQFLCDFFFSQKVARPMPMYSVPGMVDHF